MKCVLSLFGSPPHSCIFSRNGTIIDIWDCTSFSPNPCSHLNPEKEYDCEITLIPQCLWTCETVEIPEMFKVGNILFVNIRI